MLIGRGRGLISMLMSTPKPLLPISMLSLWIYCRLALLSFPSCILRHEKRGIWKVQEHRLGMKMWVLLLDGLRHFIKHDLVPLSVEMQPVIKQPRAPILMQDDEGKVEI